MDRYDVVVVGAGPAGSNSARFAALHGAKTVFMDHRKEIGVPVQCGEFLPAKEEMLRIFPDGKYIDEAYVIAPESIEHTTDSIVMVTPYMKRYRLEFRGMSVSRRIFDKTVAKSAEKAGAEFLEHTGCTGISGNIVHTTAGDIEAKVIIGADGPLSIVARSKNITLDRVLYRMVTANAVGDFGNDVTMYFGDFTYGGYGWIIPKKGFANIGLGVSSLRKGESLPVLLNKFSKLVGIDAYINRVTWWVPIGPPAGTLTYGNVLLVGDAGNMVMATNGGGIPTALIGGRDAGIAAAEHVVENKPLSSYDAMWKEHLWNALYTAYKVKKLSDKVAWSNTMLDLSMRIMGKRGLERTIRCMNLF
ncbi:MAG: NAD(P)/FAD-dependent oxidoreductase [Candidatus Thermoplasmatota archaeon]|nr:NAD(P)/FAD-dependent oxidoreductase [Candidatus Thermoplasmatota archaeon]MCL5964132.1 NAD(P)/FAD-dependent oxidoreductase [Candidatus Thermoplasmatota archaeon]